ncbi:hypothetical protein Q8A73_017859 [Channa argus]|nr:hypothetical protein Q8A73_017859 [Channa argus]
MLPERVPFALFTEKHHPSGSQNSPFLLYAAHRRRAVAAFGSVTKFLRGKWCRSTPPMNGPEEYSRAKKVDSQNQRNCPLKEHKDSGKDNYITGTAKHRLQLHGKEQEGPSGHIRPVVSELLPDPADTEEPDEIISLET